MVLNLTVEACNVKQGCAEPVFVNIEIVGKVTGLKLDDRAITTKKVSFIGNIFFWSKLY